MSVDYSRVPRLMVEFSEIIIPNYPTFYKDLNHVYAFNIYDFSSLIDTDASPAKLHDDAILHLKQLIVQNFETEA